MTAETRSKTQEQGREARSFDLRARKRTRTRLMIQTEALRLFTEKGYADTTVEEIADAAAISPRTFFRYFPTKEDVVIWDEYDDPLAADLLESRTDDEPLAETFRTLIRETLGGLYRHDPERLLLRLRLSAEVPELRARVRDEATKGIEQLAPRLGRKGAHPDDLHLQVIGASLLAAVWVALDLWQRDGGKSDLLQLLDQATDALAEGMSELQSSARGRSARAKRQSASLTRKRRSVN
jgi:AcrR family transcriptional regulator